MFPDKGSALHLPRTPYRGVFRIFHQRRCAFSLASRVRVVHTTGRWPAISSGHQSWASARSAPPLPSKVRREVWGRGNAYLYWTPFTVWWPDYVRNFCQPAISPTSRFSVIQARGNSYNHRLRRRRHAALRSLPERYQRIRLRKIGCCVSSL